MVWSILHNRVPIERRIAGDPTEAMGVGWEGIPLLRSLCLARQDEPVYSWSYELVRRGLFIADCPRRLSTGCICVRLFQNSFVVYLKNTKKKLKSIPINETKINEWINIWKTCDELHFIHYKLKKNIWSWLDDISIYRGSEN